MLPKDIEDLVWTYHEFYPKDELHKELMSLAYGEIRGPYYDFNIFGHSVFLDLPSRLCWPVRPWDGRTMHSCRAAWKRRFEWSGNNIIFRFGSRRSNSFRLN